MAEQKSDAAQKRIEARIAQILNETSLVINAGAEKGVKLGMIFAVLAETPLEIRDPETKTVLYVIQREKVRVKVIDLHEKVAICKTYRTYTPGNLASLAIVMSQPKEQLETFDPDASSLPPQLPQEERYVKIGDRAVEAQGPDLDV